MVVTADKTAASAAVAFSPEQPLVGGSITVTVTVTGRTPTGTVEVFIDGKRVGTANVVDGKATLQVTASKAGATYSGDAANKGATAPTTSATVAKHTASIDLAARATGGSATGPVEVMYGSEVTLTASVEGRSPTGTDEFVVADRTEVSGLLQFIGEGGGSLGSAPVVNGVATLTVDTLAVGVHSVMAEYSGDAQNLDPDVTTVGASGLHGSGKVAQAANAGVIHFIPKQALRHRSTAPHLGGSTCCPEPPGRLKRAASALDASHAGGSTR